jgi:hypothetical protein
MAALERIALEPRAILAAHVAFELMDWRGLRPADGIERHRLVGIATEASDLKSKWSTYGTRN